MANNNDYCGVTFDNTLKKILTHKKETGFAVDCDLQIIKLTKSPFDAEYEYTDVKNSLLFDSGFVAYQRPFDSSDNCLSPDKLNVPKNSEISLYEISEDNLSDLETLIKLSDNNEKNLSVEYINSVRHYLSSIKLKFCIYYVQAQGDFENYDFFSLTPDGYLKINLKSYTTSCNTNGINEFSQISGYGTLIIYQQGKKCPSTANILYKLEYAHSVHIKTESHYCANKDTSVCIYNINQPEEVAYANLSGETLFYNDKI